MDSVKKPHTSAEVKNRYNKKAYDQIGLVVKKGQKEIIKARASALGMSVNEYINSLIRADLETNS